MIDSMLCFATLHVALKKLHGNTNTQHAGSYD